MTAGSTFVGQFIDHDITFDQTSQLGVSQDPLITPNARTPALDLDSVFGGGPGVRPELYVPNPDGSVGPQLRIGSGGVHEDVHRTSNGDGTYTAILADPRNDENLMIAGLHCAHMLFYNRVLSHLDDIDLSPYLSNIHDQFLIARQITLWHYQWLLVNEHLPQIAGQAMVNNVLSNGNKFYKPQAGNAFMPIEFSAACYRFGHSMVRPSYRVNFTSGSGDSTNPSANPFFALVFDAKGKSHRRMTGGVTLHTAAAWRTEVTRSASLITGTLAASLFSASTSSRPDRDRREPRDTPPGALVSPRAGSIHRSPLRNLIPRS
jgi:Animal haem peroxidase